MDGASLMDMDGGSEGALLMDGVSLGASLGGLLMDGKELGKADELGGLKTQDSLHGSFNVRCIDSEILIKYIKLINNLPHLEPCHRYPCREGLPRLHLCILQMSCSNCKTPSQC